MKPRWMFFFTSFIDEETEIQRGKVTYPRSHTISDSARLSPGILTPEAPLSTSTTLLCSLILFFGHISRMGLGLRLWVDKVANA